MLTILIKNKRSHMRGGAANGYLVIPCGHPYHRLDENELGERVDVHGGWTFCDTVRAVRSFKGDAEVSDQWTEALDNYPNLNDDDKIFGFDTFHMGDDLERWPLHRVEAEITRVATLIEQAKPEAVGPIDVGAIGNYYGGLKVKKDAAGNAHWSIENWDGEHWEAIPGYLYNALIKFNAGDTE